MNVARATVAALLISLFCGSIAQADTKEELSQLLRSTEIDFGSTDKLTDAEVGSIALLEREVESARENYARSLCLYAEKIGAGKDVHHSRIDYEKAEIALAVKLKRTRDGLAAIKKQESVVQEWKRKIAHAHLNHPLPPSNL